MLFRSVGYQAGYNFNYSQGYNTFIGYQAGFSCNFNATQAYGNTFVGYAVGFNTTTGYGNVFVGCPGVNGTNQTGYANTTGLLNTYIGAACGRDMTTGSKNTIIGGYGGNQGGLTIITASNQTVISDGDGNIREYIDSSGGVRSEEHTSELQSH